MFINWNKANELAVKQVGKFSVYVSNNLEITDDDDAVWKFVLDEVRRLYGDNTPKFYDYLHALVSGGLFVFDSESEAREFYSIFEKELTDSSGMYANLISPISGCLTENT